MSRDGLQSLKEAHEALISALDSKDVAAIETAVAAFDDSLEAVRAGGLAPDADEAALAEAVLALSEQARIRVNFLTDVLRRRLERLSLLRGQGRVAVYAREGR